MLRQVSAMGTRSFSMPGWPAWILLGIALGAVPAHADFLIVAARPVADEKAVFATVESVSVVPARGRIGGTIVELNVREGDRVARGQAIATVGDEKLVL